MKIKLMLFLVLSVFLFCSSTWALDLGNNITIYDNRSSGTGWFAGSQANPHEDQEVEPGMQTGQVWDLEGFFLDGTTLAVVGGFDFEDGYGGYDSGDIFIDTDGVVKYGTDAELGQMSGDGITTISNVYGYEYVLDLDFDSMTYSVLQLSSDSFLSVYFDENEGSNPWRYKEGGSKVSGWQGKSFEFYKEGLGDSEVADLLGGSHYAFAVDLGFLPEGTEFISHFTIECGNDNLMGQGTIPAPEPATMLLVGTGLIGLAGLVRRKVKTHKSS
ncbi:MAG: hypothetical protein DRG83_13440 [Deltaproteobacteria bacterium]|nr:MAG: hypothetical protein DRG83_13440 [Deltaproteobacteria bacterium]